jgi:hypothetical protein
MFPYARRASFWRRSGSWLLVLLLWPVASWSAERVTVEHDGVTVVGTCNRGWGRVLKTVRC